MSQQKVTLGADPEFFVAKRERVAPESIGPNPYRMGSQKWQDFELNGGKPGPAKVIDTFVPITGLLGGTKKEPLPIPGVMIKGFQMQEDGPAVEFNIPPAASSEHFQNYTQHALDKLQKILIDRDLIALRDVRTVVLTPEHIEKFPSLKVVGCDPDISPYIGDGRTARPIPLYGNVRGAGGHIHIGYDKSTIPADVLAKLLDITLLLPVLKKDRQGARRMFNGCAGLYRDKPYGIEYRPLSNFWIWDTDLAKKMATTIFRLVRSVESNIIDWQAFFNTIPWHNIPIIVQQENVDHADNLVNQWMTNPLYNSVVAHVR